MECVGFFFLVEEKSRNCIVYLWFRVRSMLLLWRCEVWIEECFCFLIGFEDRWVGLGMDVIFDDGIDMIFEWGWFLILEFWDIWIFWWYYFDVMIDILNDSFEKFVLFLRKKKFVLWGYSKFGWNGYSIFFRDDREVCFVSLVLSVGLGDDVRFFIFFCRVDIFLFDFC